VPVPDDVRGDPVQPGQHLVLREFLVPAPPGLQEHDREQILGNRPVADPAKAVVVDRPRVPLEQQPEGVRVTTARTRPENRIRNVHLPFMSGVRSGVPDNAHARTVGRSSPPDSRLAFREADERWPGQCHQVSTCFPAVSTSAAAERGASRRPVMEGSARTEEKASLKRRLLPSEKRLLPLLRLARGLCESGARGGLGRLRRPTVAEHLRGGLRRLRARDLALVTGHVSDLPFSAPAGRNRTSVGRQSRVRRGPDGSQKLAPLRARD